MGLGGYLAAKSEADHYHTEREREGTFVNINDISIFGYSFLSLCSTRS